MGRATLAVLVSALGAGCQSTGHAPQRVDSIQVLGFSGCPNTPELLYRTKLAAIRSDVHASVVYLDQTKLESQDIRRGYPTPSVLVNGHDLFGMGPPSEPTMGCRVYEGGLPETHAITQRLKAINSEV